MKRIVVTCICLLWLASAATAQVRTNVIPITTANAEARAHFQRGVELLSNLRQEEAEQAFGQALKFDPNFVQAHTLHGRAAGGAAGQTEAIEASAKATGLPEAERLAVTIVAARFQGNIADAIRNAQRLVEVAPQDWRSFDELGSLMAGELRHAEAIRAFRRVAELNPTSGAAYNNLGYEYLRQANTGEAIKAFEQYAKLSPKEPNAQDSLGEALLAGGRFRESEAAFMKALALVPSFSVAWEGIAYTKFYRGDWVGGQAALTKAHTGARLQDRIDLVRVAAFASIAAGNTGAVTRLFDDAEKFNGIQPGDAAFVALYRARALIRAGKPQDALASLDRVLQLAQGPSIQSGLARNLRRQALVSTVRAAANLNDGGAVTKAISLLDQENASTTDSAVLTLLHYARGVAASSRNDYKAAHIEFGQCAETDLTCDYEHLRAAERSGDGATATALRKKLLAQYRRTPASLVIRTELDAKTGK